MIGYVSTECRWNSRILLSSLFDSLRPTPPFPRFIFLHLCKLDNVSTMITQAKARIGQHIRFSCWLAGGRSTIPASGHR